jgi:cytoskeleton-associated protein 5
VLGKGFEVVTFLVGKSTVSKKDAFIAMGGLVEKMSDIKLKGPAGDALFAISEALGPQFTFTQLHKKASVHKNPKVPCPPPHPFSESHSKAS